MRKPSPLHCQSPSSTVIESCQACGNRHLEPVIFLGYLPPVNAMHPIGRRPLEQSSYPAQLLYCSLCNLVQLGLIVDACVLFPASYPYTSSTTKILRENFADLYQECLKIVPITRNDLIVDIGSNDGNLLSNFRDNHRVLGITPEEIGRIAIERGIPTILDYFTRTVAESVLSENGPAKVVTATNVFAHMDQVNDAVECVLHLLAQDGIFITESHYLLPLIETLQYDTIYHEHLRYYSLHSLKYLLELHGMEVIHARRIPTHGGSIRVYASRKGVYPRNGSIDELLSAEAPVVSSKEQFIHFRERVVHSKLELMSCLLGIKRAGKRIYGVGAPSRASTLINYTGIDDGLLDCVVEVQGSHKIGMYIPGTLIPVEEETRLFQDQPDCALLLSWHIAEELIPKLRAKGYRGDFLIPLPSPRIVKNHG